MNVGDECWLSDGRKAFWAGEIDGQSFVRISIAQSSGEYGYEEYPDERLTPVGRVFESEPSNVLGPQTERAQIELDAIRAERRLLQDEVAALKAEKNAFSDAVSKFPDIALALDFLEGRITHVVEECAWAAPKIIPLDDFIADKDYNGRFDGLRLVSLFGTDASGRKTQWARNQYRDGSGSSVYFSPFKSQKDAEAHILAMFNAAVDEWRATGKRPDLVARFEGACDGINLPDDLRDHLEVERRKKDAEKVEKLRAELSKLTVDVAQA